MALSTTDRLPLFPLVSGCFEFIAFK